MSNVTLVYAARRVLQVEVKTKDKGKLNSAVVEKNSKPDAVHGERFS